MSSCWAGSGSEVVSLAARRRQCRWHRARRQAVQGVDRARGDRGSLSGCRPEAARRRRSADSRAEAGRGEVHEAEPGSSHFTELQLSQAAPVEADEEEGVAEEAPAAKELTCASCGAVVSALVSSRVRQAPVSGSDAAPSMHARVRCVQEAFLLSGLWRGSWLFCAMISGGLQFY